MWKMLWPLLIVVGSNTIYNISAKSTPEDANSFVSLTVTYLVALLSSLLLYFCTGGRSIGEELRQLNWSSIALGLSIVGLEFGFICVYRAGWKISVANLLASITLACVLLLVGVLLYRESLSTRQIIGMIVCLGGLFLIAR